VQIGPDADGDEIVAAVEDVAKRTSGALTLGIGGGEAVGAAFGETIEGDLARAEAIAVPITLILLVLVFGGLLAASLPLFVGVIAVLGTFLSLFVIGSLTDVSVFAINLTTALGLGLAIDYSLFIISRYREELRAGRSVEGAVVRAVETAGRTVALSGFTVAVSLSALLVFPQYFLRSFAYSGVAVVLLAMTASLVALPAMLAVVGTRIDSLRVFKVRGERREEDGFWYRTASRAMRRPVPVAMVWSPCCCCSDRRSSVFTLAVPTPACSPSQRRHVSCRMSSRRDSPVMPPRPSRSSSNAPAIPTRPASPTS